MTKLWEYLFSMYKPQTVLVIFIVAGMIWILVGAMLIKFILYLI